MHNNNMYNEFGEISLTNGDEFKVFPKTPRPEIFLDGIFVTKRDIEEVQKANDLNKNIQ